MLLASITAASAQTYFYINSISVAPAEPTESDAITISLAGDLSSSGAYIVSAEYMLMSNIVHITVLAADPGGLSVLVPHTEEVSIGLLPEGPYGILIDGTAIDDMAPEFQHSFNVSGGGPTCADLDLISIQWSTFSDTAVTVHVTNATTGFDYPGFILFDANGDTLAKETVGLFAIGNDSWHTLTIHPDADIPSGAFSGTVELWTGFYSDLACSWERTIDLCPSNECTTVYPTINNFGNGLAIGTCTWSIADDGGVVAQGQFELTPELQSDQDETCLPPGAYEMTVVFDQAPTEGQLMVGIAGDGFTQGPSQYLLFGDPAPMPFDLLAQCSDGTNSIAEVNGSSQLVVITTEVTILLRDVTGAPLGTVILCDALGKEIAHTKTGNDRVEFEVAADGLYLVRTDSAIMKVIVEQR